MDNKRFMAVLRLAERANHTGFPTPYPPLAAWDRPMKESLVRQAWAMGGPASGRSRGGPRSTDVSRGPATASERSRGGSIGLYVHIPFCSSRCSFCFLPVWGAGDRALVRRYLEALHAEAAIYGSLLDGAALRSVYFGGGTPSLLEASELKSLFGELRRRFTIPGTAQIAFEANPDSLSRAKAGLLKGLGVNWLTLGVQSLEPGVLRASRRSHTPRQARAAYESAREAGIARINVDLLYGLEGQTREGFLRDVEETASWGADQIHLNAYVNAPRTPLAKRGQVVDRREFGRFLGVQAEGMRLLESAGYSRFDADSAVKIPHPANGKRSSVSESRCRMMAERANWQGTLAFTERASIIGLGIVAVSYRRDGVRHVNVEDIKQYIRTLADGKLPVEAGVKLTARQEMIHFLLEGLGHEGVVRRKDFAVEFGTGLEGKFGPSLRRLVAREVLREEPDGYRLTGHPGSVFECSREFYEPALVKKIVGRYRLEEGRAGEGRERRAAAAAR